ncbi:hypothetical protein C8R44DRAFT_773319 [Mycena epipterygia]|nr:hypothetical protein C8R44DRAFT_773319 [Mycena epipterygia]
MDSAVQAAILAGRAVSSSMVQVELMCVVFFIFHFRAHHWKYIPCSSFNIFGSVASMIGIQFAGTFSPVHAYSILVFLYTQSVNV